ncbi:hypothetical protein PAHAL_1G091600 [Panicum hallii]|jgi:hypothetical protein|uniref:Uncharacterized protein n=1 Tax=Panicum hallii TaxID=206008 RepID=A0A2T8KUN7_9POAL|nr:hypothetical protein PAHAL_1G091600 [Panicum hallii]
MICCARPQLTSGPRVAPGWLYLLPPVNFDAEQMWRPSVIYSGPPMLRGTITMEASAHQMLNQMFERRIFTRELLALVP